MLGLVVTLISIAAISAHPYYADRIPNGYTVPNPCGSGSWQAVGHYDAIHHTHDKNPFGMAFAAQGHMWTTALCNMDSDGDGNTNGVELGDPTCVWAVGATPTGAATGHPGLCEPVGSAQCAGQSFTCGCHGHNCSGK
ncbi:temptin-like [Mercenaria mercenaria]|uniref:temptin-like n=1 Tax=Mercenaria mercenaria TaxID=6596 RepID=UPI00234ECA49|nr:temptin-like [Mercenaria mercenaria]